MLLLKSLQLKDFLSHQNTEINFEPDSKMLLEGPSGTGKSSIVEAIVWALYGVARTDNRSLIRKGAKRATVILDVYEGEKYHTITRSISSVGKHTLEIIQDGVALSGTEGLRGYQGWIENTLIGASYLLFINSVAYMQGGGDSFVGQTATKRKELLLELVKAEDYDAYYEKARVKLGEIEVERARIETEKFAAENWLAQSRERLLTKPIVERNLEKCRAFIKENDVKRTGVISRLGEIKSSEANISSWKQIIDRHEKELEVFVREITQLEESEKNLGTVNAEELRQKIASSEKTEQQRIKLLSDRPRRVGDRTTDIERFTQKISEYRSLHKCPSGVNCPHQQASLQAVEDLKKDITEAILKTEGETTALKEWQEQYDKLPKPIEIQPLINTLHLIESLKGLPKKRADLADVRKTLEEATAKISEVVTTSTIQEKAQLEEELASLDGALGNARNDDSGFSGELSALSLIEGLMAVRVRELATLTDTITGLAKQQSGLVLVKEAFSSKGIKTVIVDYVLPKLEDSVNEVLSKLSDFRIRFDTQKKSVDMESNVEGLYITVINSEGQELAFESYSGGEKLRIEVAISEALASLQKSKIGCRIFDETFQNLDSSTLENFVSLVVRLQAMFPQVLMVSHLQEVQDLFENRITIRKQDGVSSVVL